MSQLNMELRLTQLSLSLLCILSCRLQEALLLQGFSLSFRNEEEKEEKVSWQSHSHVSLTRAGSPLGLRKLIMIK